MRSLIVLSILSIIFLCAIAFGAPGQFETTLSSTSTSGAAISDPRTAVPNVSSYNHRINGRSPSLFNQSTVVTVATSTAKNDYSTFNLIDAAGNLKPLNYKSAEFSAEVGVEYKKGSNTYSVGYGQMLTTDSPFAYQGYSFGYNKSFYSGSTVAGLNFSSSDQNQPLTYYSDRRAATNKLRPEKISSGKTEFWFEQAVSEQYKTQFRLFNGARSDRPSHLGVEIRNALAINDWIFTRLDAGFLNENRWQSTLDDRGYYALTWAEAQVNMEVYYDTILTFSAGTVIEREDVTWDVDAQGNSVKNQVGTDTFGAKLGYHFGKWTIGVSALTTVSNTSFKSSSLAGNFVWEM